MAKEAKEIIEEIPYEDKLKSLSPIAHPLASKKLSKNLLKLVKKASKAKSTRRGVKEVVKSLRKGLKGIVLIAGDISPVDVISHLPILCEEANVPYIYVPSKQDLGSAGSTKRPTSCILITPTKSDEEVKEKYDEAFKEISELNEKIIV